MLKRLRQFYRGVMARQADIDEQLLGCYLDEEQRKLFYKMQVFDQCHCQNVARTAWRLAASEKENIDIRLLMQAAFLHDIGRQKEDILLLDKVFAVLLNALMPRLLPFLASKKQQGSFLQRRRYALYIYMTHAQQSCAILKAAGYEGELLALIAAHHKKGTPKDSKELSILRRADELN